MVEPSYVERFNDLKWSAIYDAARCSPRVPARRPSRESDAKYSTCDLILELEIFKPDCEKLAFHTRTNNVKIRYLVTMNVLTKLLSV